MHIDHPGADWSKRGTQAVRASAEEAARELEAPSKNAVDKEFMQEKEEKKKPDSDVVAVSVFVLIRTIKLCYRFTLMTRSYQEYVF